MNAGWQVGDLALCVDDGPCKCRAKCSAKTHKITLKAGRIYTVEGVLLFNGAIYLAVEGENHDPFWNVDGNSNRFRKIRPDEHEGCEPEFVTLLNRIKRPVTA